MPPLLIAMLRLCTYISAKRLEAPMTLVGLTAFIGRDHDELIYVVLDCHISYVTRTINIRMDGFAGILFHQGHMLVGGGMEHDMGTETLVDAFDTMDHANVSHGPG